MEKELLVSIAQMGNQTTYMNFSSDFLVLYGVSGAATVMFGKKHYEIKRGGILVIPPFSHCDFHCEPGSNVAALHIKQEFLQIVDMNRKVNAVRCHIEDDSSGVHREYDYIRMYFARIFKAYYRNGAEDWAQLFTCASQLLSVLIAYFSVLENTDSAPRDTDMFDRNERIIAYIHEHWREQLSIEQLAQQEFVSVGYLSRSFKAYTGKTFTEYLVELRLRNAARDLKSGKDTVTNIAYASGFKNTNSFIKRFKIRYGVTPKQYRKLLKEEVSLPEKANHLPNSDGVSDLLLYATIEEQLSVLPPPPMEIRRIAARVDEKEQALRHTWRRVINAGYAGDGLLAEVQSQIRQAQREIGFEYIRFHGILDRDMHVYYEDEAGRPYLDFSRVDLLLDFVLSVGAKPYVELSYMPGLLAKSQKTIFDNAVYISAFNSEEKWRFLVKGLLQHCVERYGRASVLEWKFTTIGCNCVAAGLVLQEDYLRLYHSAYESVKEVDPRFSFGGPGGFSSSIWDSRCVHDFFEYVIAQNCIPDFVCTECFPHRSVEHDMDFWLFTLSQMAVPSVLSSDEHYTRTMLRDYRKLLDGYGLSHLNIWMEQWNSTLWQRDLSNDTCYKAAWLVKNICENYDDTESFGYWTLSDFMEEFSDFGMVYHGGYGLFTYNGIPKSGWQALRLVNMLGDSKIAAGDGWLITSSQRGIQILLNHYCHYDSLYCLRYQKLEDSQQAYGVFKKDGLVKFEICLSDLPAGSYEMKQYLISTQCGSSFDAWLNMGMPRYIRGEEIEYLERVSQPQYRVETVELQGNYTTEVQLAPHEVQIILLDRVDEC